MSGIEYAIWACNPFSHFSLDRKLVVITTTAEMPVIPIDISIITREMNIAQEMVESREASSGVVGSGVRTIQIRHSIL